MGWSSGSEIAIPMVEKIKEVVKDEDQRRELYETLYEALTDHDWDSECDTAGIDPLWDEIIGYYAEDNEEYYDDDDDEEDV